MAAKESTKQLYTYMRIQSVSRQDISFHSAAFVRIRSSVASGSRILSPDTGYKTVRLISLLSPTVLVERLAMVNRETGNYQLQ